MHPILFSFGPVTVYTYGLMIAIGFLAATLLTVRFAKEEGIEAEVIYDLAFWIILGAVLGARTLYVLIEYEHYLSHPLEIIQVWKGGLVFFGGLIGGGTAALIFFRKYRLNPWRMGDMLAPSIALGHSFGRIGCLMAGCCYGAQCDLPWAVTFTDSHSLAPLGMPLHPTQIYSALMNFSIFGLLLLLRRRTLFAGQIFLVYLLLYSVGRFIVEIFRGDERGFFPGGFLSTSQGISIVVFVVAATVLYRMYQREVGK